MEKILLTLTWPVLLESCDGKTLILYKQNHLLFRCFFSQLVSHGVCIVHFVLVLYDLKGSTKATGCLQLFEMHTVFSSVLVVVLLYACCPRTCFATVLTTQPLIYRNGLPVGSCVWNSRTVASSPYSDLLLLEDCWAHYSQACADLKLLGTHRALQICLNAGVYSSTSWPVRCSSRFLCIELYRF